MPELPEVETLVRDLKDKKLVGCHIRSTHVYWDRSIATPSVSLFSKQIKNEKISDISRRAKFVVIHLKSKKKLLIHLRMTGHLRFETPGESLGPHDRVVFALSDGRELRFRDTRKFGKLYLVGENDSKLNSLGPEPLSPSFSAASFKKLMKGRARQLKPMLLDQSFLAGLGNIYVDEALWEARLHPEINSSKLKNKSLDALHGAIQKVLFLGIKNLGTSLGETDINFYSVSGRRGRNQDALQVFRRTGQPCPRCQTLIQRMIVGQRSSHICPKCQKLK